MNAVQKQTKQIMAQVRYERAERQDEERRLREQAALDKFRRAREAGDDRGGWRAAGALGVSGSVCAALHRKGLLERRPAPSGYARTWDYRGVK